MDVNDSHKMVAKPTAKTRTAAFGFKEGTSVCRVKRPNHQFPLKHCITSYICVASGLFCCVVFFSFSFLLSRLGADNEPPVAFRHLKSLINVPDVPGEKQSCLPPTQQHTYGRLFSRLSLLNEATFLDTAVPTYLNGGPQYWRSHGLTPRV